MRLLIAVTALMLFGSSLGHAQLAASHSPSIPAKSMASLEVPKTYVDAKPVARVNGVTLTEQDVVREMFILFPYARQHGGFPKDLEPEIRRGAYEMVIFEELLYQDARRKNITVPNERVASAFASFKKQFASKSEYQRYLAFETKGSEPAMRDKIRRSLIIDKMMNAEVRSKATPTAAELRAYYNANAKEFSHGDMIHLQSISIIPPEKANPDVLKEAERHAKEAYEQAKNAKSYQEFGLLAEKLSDDDFHVKFGDHNDRAASEFPPEIVAAVKTMKPGQVSNILQFGRARTIFRLIKFTPAGKTPFAEVKTKLAQDLQKMKTEQLQQTLGAKLRKNAKIEKLS